MSLNLLLVNLNEPWIIFWINKSSSSVSVCIERLRSPTKWWTTRADPQCHLWVIRLSDSFPLNAPCQCAVHILTSRDQNDLSRNSHTASCSGLWMVVVLPLILSAFEAKKRNSTRNLNSLHAGSVLREPLISTQPFVLSWAWSVYAVETVQVSHVSQRYFPFKTYSVPSSEQRISLPGQLLCKRYKEEERSVHHTSVPENNISKFQQRPNRNLVDSWGSDWDVISPLSDCSVPHKQSAQQYGKGRPTGGRWKPAEAVSKTS